MNDPNHSSNMRPAGDAVDVKGALGVCRGSFVAAGIFSCFINLLLLIPSIYMLQVYDRVLASNSEATLLMLTLITVFLLAVMGGLEWIRSQVLIVISQRVDAQLGETVFNSMFTQVLTSGGRIASAQPLSDLLQLRQFLTGSGLFAFFDAPWFPLYLALMFLFHPLFGVTALASVVILAGLAIWNETATRGELDSANRHGIEANQYAQTNLRSAEVIEAMGMLPHMRERWRAKQSAMLDAQSRASAKAGLIGTLSKTYRVAIQSLILGLGAYLAIHKAISPGLVIAGSILLGRALAPLDLMINNWKSFLAARTAYSRLQDLLKAAPTREPPMPLPAPKGSISLSGVVVVPPGSEAHPVLNDITLEIPAGMQVAIIGPSAAGKSTLVRTILGICRAERGDVRLDGAELTQWERTTLGRYLGYLPQDVQLLEGTIGENIARFGVVDAEQVVAAAQAAGVHEMILKLPDGYDTRIVGNAQIISAGQRQRIALARALYGDPAVIVLDEPNANLDRDGEIALLNALRGLQQRRCTVLLVTHRTEVLAHVDAILVLVAGKVATFGPRDQVLAALQQAPGAAAARPGTAVARFGG